MANSKEQYRGVNPDNLNQQKQGQEQEGQNQKSAEQQALEQNRQQEGSQQQSQQQQSQSQEQQNQQSQQSQQQGEQSGEDLSGYDNILIKTFGFSEDEIDDKARKVAKSYANQQSQYSQLRNSYKQVQNELNQIKQQYNNQKESSQQESQQQKASDKPKSGINSEGDVSENDLVKAGYLDSNKLEGLTDLERQREVAKAEFQYWKDAELQDYKQRREQIDKEQEEEKTKKQINQINKQRVDEDFKNVAKKGVDLAGMSDEEFNKLQSQMQMIRDPENPRLVHPKALETAAYIYGYIQNDPRSGQQQQQEQQLQDTGFNSSKQKPSNDKSLNQQLKEKSMQKFQNTTFDKKAAYRQK